MTDFAKNEVNMADISDKKTTLRTAVAEGIIEINKNTQELINSGKLPKGNLVAVTEVAGINGAKLTSRILPLCHPVRVTNCEVDVLIREEDIKVAVKVKARDRTGVEMEAMSGCSLALLNIYDMVKPVDKSAKIKEVKLIKKTGGKSGDYER